MEIKEFNSKYFYFPIIIFGIYLIIRLINEAQLISIFPLDYANDISSYIAQLYFLKECGFHNLCSYWYNGFIAFLYTPPAWYFFTLPIYLLSKNILLSTYISIVLMYIFGLIGFLLMGKLLNISRLKSIGLFFLFFANPNTIGSFLRLGRVTSFFAWVVFIYLFVILLYYKDRDLNRYFLVFIPLYAILILSHFQELILFSFILLGFFLIKDKKDKIVLILSGLAASLIASFWLIPFILNVKNSGLWIYQLSRELIYFKGNLLWSNLTSSAAVLAFTILFYIYWVQNNKSKKELLFYTPSLILGFLLFTRLIIFLPILRNIALDPYIFYFTLLSLYLFVKVKFSKNSLKIVSILFISLIFISVIISSIHSPWFTTHTKLEEDTIDLLKYVKGNYLIFGVYPTSYSPAYYSYTPIFHNLSSASGWYPHASTKQYVQGLFDLYKYFDNKECKKIKSSLEYFNVTQVLGYGDTCITLKECSFNLIESRDKVCIYNV